MHLDRHDCIIVGAGAAGLCAATYLARFKRDVLVLDAGGSRMRRIPLALNVPGWPDGVSGEELHPAMVRQATRYGALLESDRIERIERKEHGFAVQGARSYRAHTVLIATGARLVEPAIAGLERGLQQGLIRYCPICDGFETQGKRVAVFARQAGAIEEALFLRSFADDVSYLCETAEATLSATDRARAAAGGIAVVDAPVRAITLTDTAARVAFDDGHADEFDIIYPCLGCSPQSVLLQELGCALSETGGVKTDLHQRTNVSGVYAAGDVMEGLDQIASAWGQAAIAATAIHNDLRGQEKIG
jgi:thioredoxin reductase (NADPH)